MEELKCSESQVAQACLDSDKVEVNQTGTKIRRQNNKPLPEMRSVEEEGAGLKAMRVIEGYLNDESVRTNKYLLDLISADEFGWVDIHYFMALKNVSKTRVTQS